MNWSYRLYRLQFHDNSLVHQQINSKPGVYFHSLIDDRDRFLPFYDMTPLG